MEGSPMDPEEFRKWGKMMVDYVANYWETIRDREPLPRVKPGYIQAHLPDHAPDEPETWLEIFKDIEPVVMQGITHWHHPHFFAYYPTANSFPALIGDILSTGLACIGFSWNSSPSCTELEMVVIDWLAKMLDLPQHFHYSSRGKGAGMIQSTASEATLVSLLAARSKAMRRELGPVATTTAYVSSDELHGKLIAYCSDQAHSSVERSGLLTGICLRKLSSDDKDQSLRGPTLEHAILEDSNKGLVPFCLIATLGTTPTCAFDNLSELGPVCKKYNLWLHVDAAYAGSAAICPEYRWILNGIEFADTFNFNAHKLLRVTFDCSPMWFKNTDEIEQAFRVDPVYLKHENQGAVPDFRVIDLNPKLITIFEEYFQHWQIPLGRRFRSLKLWFVLRAFGVSELQEYVREHCKLAKEFTSYLASDDRFELIAPVRLGLVCFRLKGSSSLNEQLLKQINDDRRIHLVASYLGEMYFLRLAICSSMTTSSDVRFAFDVISEIASEVLTCSSHISTGHH